ncbi:MAG TPA: hypothetical protein VL977_07490 [Solirubrobacteraceae bacterium]|nr:hypothetical protein [Solirubrobacteraceae bacterium]
MDAREELIDGELVEQVVVVEAAPLPVRSGPPPIVQAAAVAATSFLAGAAAATALSRRRDGHVALLAPRRGTARGLPAPSRSTQTFLVQVTTLRRG